VKKFQHRGITVEVSIGGVLFGFWLVVGVGFPSFSFRTGAVFSRTLGHPLFLQVLAYKAKSVTRVFGCHLFGTRILGLGLGLGGFLRLQQTWSWSWIIASLLLGFLSS